MIRYVFILLIFFSLPQAQGVLDSLIAQGQEEIYQFNFNEAEQIFSSALTLNPESPLPYYYLAQIQLYKYIGSRDVGAEGIFEKYSNIALEKAEVLLDKDDEDAKTLLVLGEIYQDQATALAYRYEAFDAFWKARKSESYFEDVLELEPDNKDALVGIALYNYTLSFVPGFYQWLIGIMGMDSSKEMALDRLLYARKTQKELHPELEFHLGIVYTEYLAEFDSASFIFENLLSKYPENILFLYQYGIANKRSGQIDRAEKAFRKIVELNSDGFQQTVSFAYYHLGDIYFWKNNFEQALECYNGFIQTSFDINYLGIVSYRMAVCYFALGDKANYTKALIETKFGNEELPEDVFGVEQAEYYRIHGFGSEDLNRIKLCNLNRAGQHEKLLSKTSFIADSLTLANKIIAKCFYVDSYQRKMGVYPEQNELKELLKETENYQDGLQNYCKYLIAKNYYMSSEYSKSNEIAEDYEPDDSYNDFGFIDAKMEGIKRKLKNR